MQTIQTQHAKVRQQQRGIPLLVQEWLIDFGQEQYDGNGGVIRFFDRASLRLMEDTLGHGLVARMSEYLRCYLVQASHDGSIITLGKRYAQTHVYRH
jgi:hypothetical protein